MEEQKVISPGAGGKMGGNDELIQENHKSVGPAKPPEDGYGKGCLDGQKVK